MLITHHPMIFSPIKRIHNLDFVGERILKTDTEQYFLLC